MQLPHIAGRVVETFSSRCIRNNSVRDSEHPVNRAVDLMEAQSPVLRQPDPLFMTRTIVKSDIDL